MMKSIKVAALDNSTSPHFLDHIIPLCDLFNADLLSVDIQNERLAKNYYPNVKVISIVSLENSKKEISKNYDVLIHSIRWDKKFIETFFENNHLRSLYTPHGNSDKYPEKPWISPCENQDMVLIYGNHMIDYLKEKNAYHLIKHPFLMGNLRYRYYQKYKKWFDAIIQKKVTPHINPNKKTLLYAPTFTNISSFFHMTLDFIKNLAKKFNIIIKLHPNLADQNPELIYPFTGSAEKFQNVLTFIEFPLVYPLLEISDLYLGDFSSVGYDFLTYNRPMFFTFDEKIDDRRLTYLHQCGVLLDLKNPSYSLKIINESLKHDPFMQIREKMYCYTFEEIEDHKLKDKILLELFTNRRQNKYNTKLV